MLNGDKIWLQPNSNGLLAGLLATLCSLAPTERSTAVDPAILPTPATRSIAHWSLKPIERPSLPSLPDGRSNAVNPIDHFITAALVENGLTPSGEADRRTLIRRVYFDLTGLPPSPEEVKAFALDRSPDAYEKLVDKLLASPRYGERWARHWLDVVRFAETSGFEVNTPRPNAWPYRDYVIRAFNADKPYDRFILEQLAGDVFGEDAATGFLVAGPDDLVKSPEPVLTSNQRADELHDIVSTTGSAFLGLTVGCARCHDHKFDPIPQVDYYSLKAVFEGVRHGERKLKTADSEAREKELALDRERLVEIEAKLADFEPLAQVEKINPNELRASVSPRQNIERLTPVTARKLRFTVNQTSGLEPCLDELEVYAAEEKPRNIALASSGTRARASSVYPNSDIHRLEHINDGAHGNSRSWISNERGQGWVELEFPEPTRINRIVWGRDREQKFTDRLATDYRIEVASGSNDWRVVASSLDRNAYTPGAKEQPVVTVAGLEPEQAAEVKERVDERKKIERRMAELSRVAMIYAGTFAEPPGPTHRFHRGDSMQKRELIPAGALGLIPVKFEREAKPSGATGDPPREPERPLSPSLSPAPSGGEGARRAGEGAQIASGNSLTENQARRLALAQWIVDPANPLTARVMVNRIWQYHFGEGLVNTPSDFGANGARPTHPGLLDWLAAELVSPGGPLNRLSVEALKRSDMGTAHASTLQRFNASTVPAPWCLKHIHRLILTSATYRQASEARQDCLAIDAGSRLLWRFPPRRLEAEPIRDTILDVTGKLDFKMGGPGFSFFEPNDNYVRVYTPKQEFGPETYRRMVYGTVVRQRPDGVFGPFDCPDGGQIAPKRTRSTTPLQALNLLNSGFIIRQAGFFAERLEREAGQDVHGQVSRAFALAFQREARPTEMEAAAKLIRAQGLPLFCRALLNANEFVYVFQ